MSNKARKLIALALGVFALYSAEIVVMEAVEGHISTARSWRTAVIIGLIALAALWGAVRVWRRQSDKRADSKLTD